MTDNSSDPTAAGQLEPALPSTGFVKLSRCATASGAELLAAVLNAEGIKAEVFGAIANSLYGVWQGEIEAELWVPAEDAGRALEFLKQSTFEDLEPAPEPQHSMPVDDQGRPTVVAAAFDTARALRDAQTVLASAEIDAYLPRLEPRGDNPPGAGPRFLLRVAAEDLESAQSVLAEEAENERDELRCPKCASWRVYPDTTLLQSLSTVAGAQNESGEVECLACKHRGSREEFTPAAPGA